jgi:squalene synthase HpnC
VAVGHYENFPVASRLVPAPLRQATVAIYRFARAADDLADEGDATPAERHQALGRFAAQLRAIEAGATPSEPPFAALAAAIRTHCLAMQPFHDLLEAFIQDIDTTRYATFAALLDYCRRSANPVGRLVLALHGVDAPGNVAASDAICTGLQLANFWQDIALDWRKGRVYLPQEDLDRFGIDEAAIAAGRCDARWRELVAFECARTRGLLESGRPLLRAVPWRLRLELAGVIEGGRRILQRIVAVDGDVFAHRPTLRAADWAMVALHAVRSSRAVSS